MPFLFSLPKSIFMLSLKHLFRGVAILSLLFFNQEKVNAQCTFTYQYPSSTFPIPTTLGQSYTITTCNYGGEYSQGSSPVSGGTYTVSSSNSADYFTVRTGTYNGPVVAYGPTPLTFTAPSNANLFFHISSNSSCGMGTGCRTTSITYGAPYNPCASIGAVSACGGSTTTTIASGSGAWALGTWAPPGKEYLYTYTPTVTGTYTITQNTNTTGYVDYFFKVASGGCNNSGWTLIDDLLGTSTTVTFSMTAGTQYYIMLDPEHTTGTTSNWTINGPGATTPTVSAGASTICNGGAGTTLTATGTLNTSAAWTWYTGSCGGTSAGTGATLSVNPTTTTTYYVRGTGGCAPDGSCGQITVTVNDPASIGTQPSVAETVCEGDPLNLSVVASNAASYQWYLNSNPISGANSSTYNVAATTSADAGTYYVEVIANSPCANVTSGNSVVTINPPVSISLQPNAINNICDGSPLTLNVSASNATSYQWYKDGNPLSDIGTITGSGTASLNISSTAPADAGTYYVVMGAQTACAQQTSANAAVNILPRPTATTTVNGAATVCDGTPTNIDIALTGTGPWIFDYYDGTTTTNVNTSTNPYSFSVNPSITTMYSITGLADVNCIANSGDYAATATVTVNPRPTVTITNNGPSIICNGDNTSIDLTFTGTGPWDFTYTDGTTPISVAGNTNTTYNLPISPTTTTTYSVTALNDINCMATGPDMTSTASVTVNYAPAIVSSPNATSACSGVGTTLTVGATGTNLSYQWRMNGNPISDNSIYSGTQTSTLTISSVTGMTGLYDVEISGTCPPMITSSSANVVEDVNNTWDGSASTAWSDPDNWSCGTIPIVTTDVLIPTGPTNMPLVDIPTAICNSLTIDPSASVLFTGTNNVLELKSNITNNGIFDPSAGRIILSGISVQNIPAVTYGNLTIDGGGLKMLDGNASVTGILNLINGHVILAGYDLTLDVPVQTLGGSASSFIVTNDTGEVIGRNMGVGGNPDAATFHVGINATSYTPIMLENLGTSDDYNVRVMQNVYEDGYGISPIMVSNPVVNRTWMVDEATDGGSIVNMTPYWNAVDEINGFVQSNVYVAHYLNNMWIGYTTSSSTAPPAGTFGSLFSAFADSIQTFSPFTVASTGQWPLSSKLDKIAAINAGNRNRIDWSTASETGGDKFEIQRSIDGRSFAGIGNAEGNGSASSYSYWDAAPKDGKNYYRVKMTDVTGKEFYTTVVSATVSGNGAFSVNAYPNPVSGVLTVVANGEMGSDASIIVTDVTGSVVKTISVKDNISEINMSELAGGVFFVKYSDKVQQETIKVNKH